MREKGKRKLSTTPSPTRSRRLPAWRARATSLSARRPLLWPRPASSRRHRTRARSQKRPPHSTRPGAARRRASRAPRPSCARRAPSGPATTLHRRTKRSYPWRRPTTARRSRPTRRRGHPHPTRSTELSDLPITIIHVPLVWFRSRPTRCRRARPPPPLRGGGATPFGALV